MKDRKSLDLTGVKQIDSFDSNEFLLETSQGWMLVQGKDLTLGKLDTERGEVSIRGLIDRLEYIVNKKVPARNRFWVKIAEMILSPQQFQALVYHFFSGWVFALTWSGMNRLTWHYRRHFVRWVIETLYFFLFVTLMYAGLFADHRRADADLF